MTDIMKYIYLNNNSWYVCMPELDFRWCSQCQFEFYVWRLCLELTKALIPSDWFCVHAGIGSLPHHGLVLQ